jgi:F-type H+-transporting ATPase subunit gamma
MAEKEVKGRIASVKNVQKITRAMEMISAARLRRAEQRVQALRPYASAIRRMTREAADAAGALPSLPIMREREQVQRVGILLVASDRGLAGAFNSQVLRAAVRASSEFGGTEVVYAAVGRRSASSLAFRKLPVEGTYTGFTDRPSYANARDIAADMIAAYVDGRLDRVDVFYNRYISPLQQQVTRETLLPLQQATILDAGEEEPAQDEPQDTGAKRALVEYEPDPEDILERLVPAYVEISIYRALLESTASEHGARMTAMRNASDNAGDIIADLTLQMNRQRQADITQEIMEVVAGAESLV